MSEAIETLADAFPSELRQRAAEVASLFKRAGATLSPGTLRFAVKGDGLSAPARVYVDEGSVVANEGLARNLADCLLTRHHDGHVRARALIRIIVLNEPWSIPFVVLLIGEYVIEILDGIDASFEKIDQAAVACRIERSRTTGNSSGRERPPHRFRTTPPLTN